ncbi:MAG: LPS-assembly protein LptD [Kangiellaceae bacterium]
MQNKHLQDKSQKQLNHGFAVISLFMISLSTTAAESQEEDRDIVEGDEVKLFESRFPLNSDSPLSINYDYSAFESCVYPQQQALSKIPDSNNSISSSLVNKYEDKTQQYSTEKFSIKADGIPVNNEELIKLTGNVSMITESSILKADELVRNKVTGVDQAIGKITLETEESLLQANDFYRDGVSQTMTLSDVDYRYFTINGNGKAENIEVDQSQNLSTLKNLTFTTCPNGDASWLFSADELTLDASKGWAEAWGMWFKIKNIPIFYFPYFNFPIDDNRKSGFLMPDVSRNSRNGLDVKMPIYWNIKPNMDATFVPRNVRNRGNQLGIEYRYLTEFTSNRLAVEALSNDVLARGSLQSNPELADGNYGLSKDRWGVAFNNKTRWNKNWSAAISASKVSDRDYFRDLGTGLINQSSDTSESLLESYGNISYVGEKWSNSLILESTQSLIGQEPYRKIPSLISRAEHFDLETGLFWEFDSEFAKFTHTDKTRTHGIRLNLKPTVSMPLRNAYSWMTPKLSFQTTHYEQKYPLQAGLNNQSGASNNVIQTNLAQNIGVADSELSLSRSLPIFSFDTGLIFDRQFTVKKRSTEEASSEANPYTQNLLTNTNTQVITHTLEPRIFYAYIPYKDQSQINNFDTRLPDFNFNQLWRANRFSGNDRIGDTNHIALAITNRFTDNTSGREIASFSIGRKYFFERRHVTLLTQDNLNQEVTPTQTEAGQQNNVITSSNSQSDIQQLDNNRIEQSALLAEFSYRASSKLELASYIEWDDSDESEGQRQGTRKARSRIKYEPIANHVVNLSHRLRNEFGNSSEELDLSFLWPVNEQWRVVGKWYNDLKNNRTIETLFGVEYKSCCWAVSLVSRRYLDVRLDAFGNPIEIDSSQGLANEFENSVRLDFDIILGQKSPKSSGVAKLISNSIRNF